MPPRDPRQWASFSVDLPASRKLAGARPDAKWLYVCGVLWSRQNGTDGHLPPAAVVGSAGVPPKAARTLVERDLWHEKGHACPACPQPLYEGEVVVHDFLVHQDSAAVVKERSAVKAAAGRVANHKRWNHQGPLEGCPRCPE